MNDDGYLKFESIFSKNHDDRDVLEFSIELRRYIPSAEESISTVAALKGFLVQAGYLPEMDDEWYFEIFDMRSAHAMEAFGILTNAQQMLRRALKARMPLDECEAIAHLERVWVDPSHRGKGIALRLMREAQHVLGRAGLLVIMKGHPDGGEVSDSDCLRLSKYYQSDKRLGFVSVSKRRYPGWLVAVWEEPIAYDGDDVLLLEQA